MGRSAYLSNGQLMVGLNRHGLIHDFYYPYVGLDNFTNARSTSHKIGVHVDGDFSWLEDETWHMHGDIEDDAMITNISLRNDTLGVEISFKDAVLIDKNAFCRLITVKNLRDYDRTIKLFLHQVFQISRGGRADTALYVPDAPYVLDYKGRVSLLIYAQKTDGTPFDQFAIGNYGIEGKEGTFRDAEDGELSGNLVEHGGVDSVLRVSLDVTAQGESQAEYWIAAASSQNDAEKIHEAIRTSGLAKVLEQNRRHWQEWLNRASISFRKLPDDERILAQKSLLVIKAHIDTRGGIIASGDSSIYNYGRDYYNYVWPRDAAFALWPLIRLGYSEEARKFFLFARDTIHPDGYLMHKYQPDYAIGSTWHPLLHNNRQELAIQEDETAIVIFMLSEYVRVTKDIELARELYHSLIRPAANFMAQFIDKATSLPHASYDLWEQKFLTSTYTTFVTQQALYQAARFADIFTAPEDAVQWRAAAEQIEQGKKLLFDSERQTYRKGLLLMPSGDLELENTVDASSLYGACMFHNGNGELPMPVHATAQVVEERLLAQSPDGGVIRFEQDGYFLSRTEYKGNPWIVCTLWLAQYYLATNRRDDALELIAWVKRHVRGSLFSEQTDPVDGHPIGVMPLVWSHAEFVNTLLDTIE